MRGGGRASIDCGASPLPDEMVSGPSMRVLTVYGRIYADCLRQALAGIRKNPGRSCSRSAC